MSPVTEIRPRPNDDEAAALITAVHAVLAATTVPADDMQSDTRWQRAARREAIAVRTERHDTWGVTRR